MFKAFDEILPEFVLIPEIFVDIACECNMMHCIFTEIAYSFAVMLDMFNMMLAMFFEIFSVFFATF